MTSPTLVLGLGGFGSAVVLEAKRLYYRLSTAHRLPTAFLAIDQKDEIEDPEGLLTPEERLALRPHRASEILENLGATGNERSGWRELLDWFPDGRSLQLINAVEPSGARQYRPLGRLGLFAADEFVDRAIRKGIQRARCADPARDPESNIRIALASSLSGGAGSGMLLDVAHLARRADDFSFLFAYLAIPSPISDIDATERGEANTYAALRELVALRTKTVEFEARYERIRPIHLASRLRRELFARTFLFSSTQSCDASPSAAQRAARSIVAQLDHRVQSATIGAVQGMALLVDEIEQRVSGALTFGTSSANWIEGQDLLALGDSTPAMSGAQALGAVEVADPSNIQEPAASAIGPVEGVGPRRMDPDKEKRWRQMIKSDVEVVSSALGEEIRKRLKALLESPSQGWPASKQDESEISSLEDLIAIGGSGEGGNWSVDATRLEAHGVFRATLAEAKLRAANEKFMKGWEAAETTSPAWAGDTQEGREIFRRWAEIRQKVRPAGFWARLLRTLFPVRRNPGLFADRCKTLYALTEKPDFATRLAVAVERCAATLLPEQRSTAQRREKSAELPAPTGSAAGPEASSAESGTSSNREPAATVASVRDKLWETHLRRVVGNLRESIFGDQEPRPSRRAFLLALIPESFPWPTGLHGLKSAIGNVATDVKARSLVEVYSGDRLWLIFEDLFNAADNVRLIDHYQSAYENGEPRELYHLDQRWLASLGEHKRVNTSEPTPPETQATARPPI